MPPIIEVNHVWKAYQKGIDRRYKSLRDTFVDIPGRLFGGDKEQFWALEDINFRVAAGESVGIIGRNGAGKSTLLKILSRITPPTKGEIILRGRVASLLEVGTGFHPELTGRENVYFNGSILGMKHQEIKKKFDEIVDFSGVESFIDTPLKHYSSGMQMRLAFAVAAHLDAEILLIDEVLAVGDAEFQKKCIGKMGEVSKGEGKTILFVSHDINAVKKLCLNALLIKNGKIYIADSVNSVIENYLNFEQGLNSSNSLNTSQRSGNGIIRINTIKISTQKERNSNLIYSGDDLFVDLFIDSTFEVHDRVCIHLGVEDRFSHRIALLKSEWLLDSVSTNDTNKIIRFKIINLSLKNGLYFISALISVKGITSDYLPNAIQFEVTNSDFYKINKPIENHDGYFLFDFEISNI